MTAHVRLQNEEWSGQGPDLIDTQRSRAGVSSAAPAGRSSEPSEDGGYAPTALDTDGPAPLPALRTSNALAERQLLTADDVALILQVPRSLVYALARRGELPAVRIGERYVRFRAEAIERWTEALEEWPLALCASSTGGRRMALIGGSPPTVHRGASGTSLRRRVNAPEPGIRRVGPDAS
jgi:excisionase family DNA binding protein